jgi:NTE family protein
LDVKKFSDLKIPFCAVATSVKSGDAVYIEEGSVFQGVRASMAIPPFFSPTKIHNRLLIDGAFSCPIPVQKVIKMGADIVIAVNLEDDYIYKLKKFTNVFGLSLHSISIFIRALSAADAQSADIVISPKVGKYSWGDLDKAKDIIKAGEKAAKFKIEDIKSEVNFPAL